MANAEVSVSLVNNKGVVVSKNLSNSPLASTMFRVLLTKNPVTKGVWKLRIENTSQFEQIFVGFSWSTENLPTTKMPVAE